MAQQEHEGRPDQAGNDSEACPIDHVHLARYTMGNRALEIEVLTLFADQAPEYLVQMEEAESQKAWRDAVHTLKGSALAVGAVRVAEAARRAEAVPFTDPHARRLEAVAGIRETLAAARAHIVSLSSAG